MRYYGQGAEVPVSIAYEPVTEKTGAAILKSFEEQYRKLYGRTVPGAKPQVITWRLTGRAQTRGHHFEWGDDRVKETAPPRGSREIYLPLRKAYGKVAVYERYAVSPGRVLEGPLVLEERECTIVVPVKSSVTILPDLTVSVTIREFD